MGNEPAAAVPPIASVRQRATRALRRPHNWMQLAKFSGVGVSGYVVNLAVYAALLRGAGLHYALAATVSFLVAVTNNYTWNRLWTFHALRGRGERGEGEQGEGDPPHRARPVTSGTTRACCRRS